jgi:hypothetical protein
MNEKADQSARNELQGIARYVRDRLPEKWGFVILAFPFGALGRLNYVANARREDIVRVMREFITMTEADFGQHIIESDRDTELGRLRQRVAMLEGKLAAYRKQQGEG